MRERLRNRLRNWVLRRYCNAVLENDFLEIGQARGKDGKLVSIVKIGGVPLTDEETRVLAEDARATVRMNALPRLIADMRATAIDKMVNTSTNVEDMYFSKAMLYTCDEILKKLKKLSNL